MRRRDFLTQMAAWMALSNAGLATSRRFAEAAPAAASRFSPADDALLDEIQQACWRFFWENTDAATGLVKDRSRADGPDERPIASIAATGFGLTATCVAVQRGYVDRIAASERVRATLRFLWESFPHQHGFYYHFADAKTGARAFRSEVSSVDSTLLLCGILTCRQYFNDSHSDDSDIRRLATQIYQRMDWPWMLNGGPTLSHGWKPETGFLPSRWNHYSEHMMIDLLAIGSPTYPISATVWDAWERPHYHYYGQDYIGSPAPLFVHQFSHAWFDFRRRRDRYADYFENSIRATRAHRKFCLALKHEFPDYAPDLWGITASDSAHGYVAWGGPPEKGKIDGTVVPAASAGSLPFLPGDCMGVLRRLRKEFGERIWQRYGFVDAFNPLTGWTNPDVIGIDLGITLLMAENARSGLVWEIFMKNPEARSAMNAVGFRPPWKKNAAT